jgi:hypothetical protein
MSRLYVFADDSMMGREAGTPGAMKGTAYIAGGGPAPRPEAGGGQAGSYFQNVPFIARTLGLPDDDRGKRRDAHRVQGLRGRTVPWGAGRARSTAAGDLRRR